MGWLLVQRSLTWGVCLNVCDLETAKMRRPRPDLGCGAEEECGKVRKEEVAAKYQVLLQF